MLTYKTQLHFESQATCVFAQTPCKALGGRLSHSGHSPAGRMKFSGLGCLEVGLTEIAGEPEITGMEVSEFGRSCGVSPLRDLVKTLTTCCRRPNPPPTGPQAFLCEMGHHPQGSPGSEHLSPWPGCSSDHMPLCPSQYQVWDQLMPPPGASASQPAKEQNAGCQLCGWCVGATLALHGARSWRALLPFPWVRLTEHLRAQEMVLVLYWSPLPQDAQVWGPRGHQAGGGSESKPLSLQIASGLLPASLSQHLNSLGFPCFRWSSPGADGPLSLGPGTDSHVCAL